MLRFCHLYATFLWASLRNVTRIRKQLVVNRCYYMALYHFQTRRHLILIIRDYLTAFWLSPKVSIRHPIISPRALARGLIMVDG